MVDTSVTAADLPLVKPDLQAQIVPTGSSATVFGTVSSVGVIATTSSGVASFPVTLAVTGSPASLYAGGTASVSIIVKEVADALVVPTAAITTVDGKTVVTLVKDGQQVSTPVALGMVQGNLTQITAGLSEGDEVLVTRSGTTPGQGGGSGTATRTRGSGGLGGGGTQAAHPPAVARGPAGRGWAVTAIVPDPAATAVLPSSQQPDAPNPMLRLRGVGKTYSTGSLQVHALRDIDLDIQEGEFVAVVGPSGSGKSTLMHILGCLDVPTEGSYQLAGVDVSSMDERELAHVRNQRIGFVFQQFNLLPPWLRRAMSSCHSCMPGCPATNATSGQSTRWRRSAWRTGSTTGPGSSPAASSNAFRWLARSSPTPTSSLPTSPPATSTLCRALTSLACCGGCTSRDAPSSSSRTSTTLPTWPGEP